MSYHRRHLENHLSEMAKHFKIVLVTGARQVGKSTLLGHLFPKHKIFVFDPVQDLYGVRRDPDLFLENFKGPLILDEIQYAPELLPALKRKVDTSNAKGQYLLTGSQNIQMLKTVAESLAGRVGIIHLEGMSSYEMENKTLPDKTWLDDYLENPLSLLENFQGLLPSNYNLFEQLWRGTLPGCMDFSNTLIPDYYHSYIQTYLERDIRLLEGIRDLPLFDRFLGILSALTGQEINHAQLGRELGMASSTSHRWLDLLQHTYQWREVWPYHGNTIKRISKKRKGYLTEVGLVCHLQRISSPDALARNPHLGAIFETHCVNHLFKLMTASIQPPQIYHWRTGGGAEVDLLLERDQHFYPIEIKCKTNLTAQDARGLQHFRDTYPNLSIKPALILYAGKECYRMNEDCIAFPWNGSCR